VYAVCAASALRSAVRLAAGGLYFIVRRLGEDLLLGTRRSRAFWLFGVGNAERGPEWHD